MSALQGKTTVDRRQEVRRVLAVALVMNIAMSLLKLSVGVLSGSLAVIADAMHSATDALSSLTGLITNSLSDPRPDRDHPYGCLLYTSPSPRDQRGSRMPSSA